MGKYTTKKTDEEGNVFWESTDGSSHKTRKSAWEHSKTLLGESESEVKTETVSEPEITVEDESPQWASFDFGATDGEVVEVIPSTLKKIRGNQPEGRKKTKRQLEIERQNNLALLTMGYRTGDHLMTRYRRALLEDPQAEAIKHTQEDYVWISEITDAALQDNGISIQTMVSPTMYAGIANVYWFGTPLTRIHQEAEKSPFKGRFAGAGRMLERIPLIGKRLKKRRLEKSLQAIEGEDVAES
tara:strand:- start:5709 stop:6434 length:726 start_codon:yes stop_codon:yes gene_type:complete